MFEQPTVSIISKDFSSPFSSSRLLFDHRPAKETLHGRG
jgi:hypothetical protein